MCFSRTSLPVRWHRHAAGAAVVADRGRGHNGPLDSDSQADPGSIRPACCSKMIINCASNETVPVDLHALSAACTSDAFKEILEKALQEAAGDAVKAQLQAQDDTGAAWKLVAALLSKGPIDNFKWEDIPTVLKLADKYQLSGVMHTCQEHMIQALALHVSKKDGTHAPQLAQPLALPVPPALGCLTKSGRTQLTGEATLGMELLSLLHAYNMHGCYQLLFWAYTRQLQQELKSTAARVCAVGATIRQISLLSALKEFCKQQNTGAQASVLIDMLYDTLQCLDGTAP